MEQIEHIVQGHAPLKCGEITSVFENTQSTKKVKDAFTDEQNFQSSSGGIITRMGVQFIDGRGLEKTGTNVPENLSRTTKP